MRVAADEDGITRAAAAVRDGELAIYPTETCYGIGCDALNEDAVDAVYRAKQRPREKGLTVVVADLAMAADYCVLSDMERRLCEAFMPGPLTLVAEKRDAVPDVLNDAFVFRVPGSDVARALSREAGRPVVATSANLSGRPANYAVDTIDPAVQDAASVVVDAGTLTEQSPSTIVALRDGDLVVHRAGPIAEAEIEGLLHG